MLKIIFAATPALACPSLEALHQLDREGQLQLCAVLTQADQPAGRKRILQPSPIKAHAQELGIGNILSPAKLDASLRQQVAQLQADLLVVFAYGKIFRQRFLDLFALGGINLHPSALPEWRGPSPIEAQLLHGAEQLAISAQRISLEMDAGDVLQQQFYPLAPEADYHSAAQLAATEGAKLLRQCCLKIGQDGAGYLATARPQQHDKATYCQLIRKEYGRIDWGQSALQISRQCRAYSHWPKAHTWMDWPNTDSASAALQVNILRASLWLPDGDEQALLQRYIELNPVQPGDILAFHPQAGLLTLCGQGVLAIEQLQRQNKNVCSAKEFSNQLHDLPKWNATLAEAQPVTRHRFYMKQQV